MSEHVTVTTADGIRVIRMARVEKKNALTAAMYGAMADAVMSAADDDAVRAITILGSPGAFTAGNDLHDFIKLATGGASGRDVNRFLLALAEGTKPLVAGVDGLAIGVGTTMLLHCDYVVASDRSRFATPFVDLGLVPEAASSLLGPRIMGHQRAFELLVMGKPFDAARALGAGFVNEVVSADALEQTTLDAAAHIARKAPGAVAISRRLLRGDPAEAVARIREELVLFNERLSSPEAHDAFTAFFARR